MSLCHVLKLEDAASTSGDSIIIMNPRFRRKRKKVAFKKASNTLIN